LLIRHSNYSAILLSKHTPTDCIFGDFAHWVVPKDFELRNIILFLNTVRV